MDRDPRKSRLNKPAGMEPTVRLDTSLTHFQVIPKTPSPRKTTYSDRFIPCRASSRLDALAMVEKSSPAKEGGNDLYLRLLRAELFGTESFPFSPGGGGQGSPVSPSKNMFRFKMDHSSPSSPLSGKVSGQDTGALSECSTPPKPPRKVPKTPHKVLDAPSLQDDFYLNLVDWSSQNVLAVGLGTCVYLWNASTSKVTKLCDLGNRDGVCAVQWTREGSYLAVGTSLGDIQIWDGTRCKKIRSMAGHQTRTGVLAWSSCILASGSRDRNILQHDLRSSNDFINKLSGHRSEVCGLKWSQDDRELASGGNDNQLLVWNQRSQRPMLRFTEHTAAVKAIAWSPHQQGLLASGGGTADRCIRFWNTTKSNILNCIDTGSQVCNIAWSKNLNELVSTHGYSQNQIMLWKYPSMGKIVTLSGHTLRVLYLATSPDGQTIVTGAGDETLRFWNVFPSVKASIGRSLDGYTLPKSLRSGERGKAARISAETARRTGRRNSQVARTSENNASTEDSTDQTTSDEELSDLGIRAALSMLKFYKREISPLLLPSCRYVPTCSEYSMQAYRRYGVLKGTILTAWRLCRCNPLGGHGFDPPRWFGEENPPADL